MTWSLYRSQDAQRRLADAIEEADRLDPGWRLEELEARRKRIPDDRNAALQVSKVHAALPPNLRIANWSFDYVPDLREPQVQLQSDQSLRLREGLKQVQAALPAARKLADMPEGRYSVQVTADMINTRLPGLDSLREIIQVLKADAILQAQNGEGDGALQSCRALINCARSVGDEPYLVSQLVRLGGRSTGLGLVVRVLAQAEPSERALAQVQELLTREDREPALLYALRGERVLADGIATFLEAPGQSELSRLNRVLFPALGQLPPQLGYLSRTTIRSQRAEVLRFSTRAVEIAKLPANERQVPLRELDAERKQTGGLSYTLCPRYQSLLAFTENDAYLRAVQTLVACERYRRARARWPASLAELVPQYLGQVPVDPFDGSPMKYMRLSDGVVVYSVGPNLRDDHGAIRKSGKATPDDIGAIGSGTSVPGENRHPEMPVKRRGRVLAPSLFSGPPRRFDVSKSWCVLARATSTPSLRCLLAPINQNPSANYQASRQSSSVSSEMRP